MVNNKNFWQGKKVLLTGHTGFKGAWLSLWLKTLGANVIGYSLDPISETNLFSLLKIEEEIVSVYGNIQNIDFLQETLKKYNPEIVIHMAAQSLVRKSYINPLDTYMTNVMGTVNILECIRYVDSVKSVVIVTTDKCYENKETNIGYEEHYSLGGVDPYSSSKACAELVTNSYRKSFFSTNKTCFIASARAGNVIGGGDWSEDRLIPDVIKAVLENRSVLIRNPKAIRPWQHVLEPLSAYMLLAEKLYTDGCNYAESWNFGPDLKDVKSVEWIINKINELWSEPIHWDIDKSNHPHEAQKLILNCNKALSKLNWAPKWDINTALEKTIEWYKAYQNKNDLRSITLQQILTYENSMRLQKL